MPSQHFLDGKAARLLAVLVALLAVAALGWINRAAFMGAPEAAPPSNPELAACLAERVGAVDKMQQDGVVSAAQYEQFKARAVAFCQAQFPG